MHTRGEEKALFDGFWNTSDFDVRNTYLCGCINVVEVRRRYSGKGRESSHEEVILKNTMYKTEKSPLKYVK